jgi:hypothetical protein
MKVYTKEYICNYVTTYIINASYKQSDIVNQMADRLFLILHSIKEDEEDIMQAIIDSIPLSPMFLNMIATDSITSDMVSELLNAYILDGGNRKFKSILDPDSDQIVSESESDDDAMMMQYLEYLSD